MLKDGISFRYVVLDTWEKFGYSPMEWDEIDKETQMELVQKRNLDLDHEEWIKEKSRENDGSSGNPRRRKPKKKRR